MTTLTRERIEGLTRLVDDADDLPVSLTRSVFVALLAAALRDADVRELDEWAAGEDRGWEMARNVRGMSCATYQDREWEHYVGPAPSEARRAAAAAIRGSRE